MINLGSIKRAFRPAALFAFVAAAGLMPTSDRAQADVPEYWTRETFHTEKSTFAAALSGDDDDAAERRSARRTAVRAARASSDDDDGERRTGRRAAPRKSIAEGGHRPPPRRDSKAKAKSVRVASLGDTAVPSAKPERTLSGGGGIRWVASSGCLNGTLRGVLAQIASRFGSVTVNSTCRSKRHNARVGGASRSMHLTGDAADFRIRGNWGAASGFIRGLVGGFKHYGGGLFHIDTGARRSW